MQKDLENGTSPRKLSRNPKKILRVPNLASTFNNALLIGPDLLANMLDIVIRFSKHAVDALADTERIVLQVAIREDQSTQRFLWLEDGIVPT